MMATAHPIRSAAAAICDTSRERISLHIGNPMQSETASGCVAPSDPLAASRESF